MATQTAPSNLREISLPQGTIRYRDVGTGPTLVFVHGALVNSGLWRKVIPSLAPNFRCVAPDLPLGAHSLPMGPGAELTPPGVAKILADFIAALDLHDVTLIGNDTGGAICQITITQHPERITRLVLTNCDAFEQFFPTIFSPLSHGPRIFGVGFTNTMARILRARFAQRLLVATVSGSHFSDQELDAYFTPLLTNPAVRQDTNRFLASVSNRYTLAAATAFANFRHPVLIIWGKNDLFFSKKLAHRLQRAFPNAVLKFVAGSRAFVSEDQPDTLARLITEFVHEPALA